MSTREVSLEGTPPWGFRMNGGADAGHPLRISRVNPGSKAESKGVREGDLITSLNGQSTKCLTNSESHALLRTVKENLRLGLNEDKNSSPRRRSKEIKSTSSTTADKEQSPQLNQQTNSKGDTQTETGKPSSSKSRRQRRAKLKMKLKELLGYKETKGRIINLHPNLVDSNGEKLPTNSGGPSSIQSDTNSDNSSAILYDNYQDSSKGGTLEKEQFNNNNDIQNSLYFNKSVTPPRNSQQNYSLSTISNSSDSRPGSPLPVIIPIDEPKPATVTVLQHNVQHATINNCTVEIIRQKEEVSVEDISELNIKSDKARYLSEDICVPKHQPLNSTKGEIVSVVITDTEEGKPNKNQVAKVIVHHPDDICEESVKFLPSNDLSELAVSLQPVEEIDHSYELTINDLHTPLITNTEEKRLRTFLKTLKLQAPEDVQTEEIQVIYPSYTMDPQMYYYMPKRQLDVISEETSDLSDMDKPNNEAIKLQNNLTNREVETYGGIDTSWRDGQSLEEFSDILIVSDSHSDTDVLTDEAKLFKFDKKGCIEKNLKPLENEENKVNAAKVLVNNKKVPTSNLNRTPPTVSSMKTTNLTSKPPRKPPYEKPIPSVAIVKNVVSSYYNSKFVTEPITIQNKPLSNEIKIDTLPSNKPITKNDVEIVYIDSSDSDALSTKSANSSFSSIKSHDIEQTSTDDIDRENDSNIHNEEKDMSIKNIISDITQTVIDMTNNANDKSSDNNTFRLQKYSVSERPEDIVLGSNSLPDRRFSYPISKNDVEISKENEIDDSCNMFSCSSESFSSQSTTRHYYLSQVLTLKELCSNVILSLPLGLEMLKQLGIEYSDIDQYSGYIPEGSECSSLSRNPVSEKELKLIQDDTENEISVSQDFPSFIEPIENENVKTTTVEIVEKQIPEPWVGVPIESNPQLLVCFPQSQLKQTTPTNQETIDLLDLHRKFIERRGYHEKSPISKRTYENDKKETEEEINQFTALKKYHESRQEKMRKSQKTDEVDYKSHVKSEVNQNILQASNESIKNTNNSSSDKEELVLVYNVTPRKEADNECNDKDKDNNVGTSRLLELIQNLEPESSISNRSADVSYPQWILVPKNFVEDQKEITGTSTITTSNISCVKKTETNLDLSNVSSCKKNDKQEKIRPKSLPTADNVLHRNMYDEYMDKLAALAERRQMKIIRISPSSSSGTVQTMAEIGQIENEFMIKVRERMNKLGLTIEDDVENVEQEKILIQKSKEVLPKHLQELMEITEECGGVWSPVQTPESERKKFDFTGETKREKTNVAHVESEPQPVVWTPKSAGASPTLERKYRAVNFQSPPPKRKELNLKEEPKLPKELPVENSRLVTSTSENSTLSTQLRLPPAQNPTITLLQKAREGQIPKGAQYLEESEIHSGINQDEILYTIKKEYTTSEDDRTKKIVELSPRKFEGIGPTTKEGIPLVLRSEIKEDNQQKWYKRMYDSLHKADHDKDFVTVRYKTKRRGQYPYSYTGGYASEPERLGYDSDISVSKYATLDRRKIRNKENDFTTSTLPRNKYSPAVKHALDIYKNQPGKIEDYEPGHSSIAEQETKQWWDEVLDIFDGELNQQSKSQYSTPRTGRPFTYALKDTGYESDSTLVFKRRENMNQLSPTEQKMAYKVIQRGGDVPLHGLRKPAPERPKEPLGNPIPTPPRDLISRPHSQESPHRYVESEVNIHYRSPVRSEAKAIWPEEELAERQAEIMRRIYQEQRRTKYLNELHDMYSRRHTDNFIPSQKSPIPLNRYDDFPLETQPPRPRDRTPEPKLVARALYNFVGQTSRELSFRRGDIIYVRRQIDKNWYEGEHNAMIGLFPFNYVEIIPYDGIRTLPKKANEGQARAKFNFQAQTHLELSLVKGELVLLTRRVDENWFEGRIGSRKGIFPVSYVEVLVEPGERPMSPATPVSTKPIVAPASHSVMLNGAKDLGQQHYQPPRPALYSSSSLPAQSKMGDISLVNQTLHIETQSDPVPYRVLYNYKPQNDDELELKEGDVVYVMEKCDDGWYVGSLHRNGQFGTFPGNYVERIQ